MVFDQTNSLKWFNLVNFTQFEVDFNRILSNHSNLILESQNIEIQINSAEFVRVY